MPLELVFVKVKAAAEKVLEHAAAAALLSFQPNGFC